MTTSEKNVELMLEIFRAIERRDQHRMFELVHPDAEFLWPPKKSSSTGSKRASAPPGTASTLPCLDFISSATANSHAPKCSTSILRPSLPSSPRPKVRPLPRRRKLDGYSLLTPSQCQLCSTHV